MTAFLPPPYRLIEKEITESTNTDALELARGGAPAFTVVWARKQTHARGRFSRKWIAELGNLYWSVIVRPKVRRPETIVFASALAIADAVRDFVPPTHTIKIKWPNDVLIDGAKLSGTLVEQQGGAVVVGIGINVSRAPDPSQMLYPATSLVDSGSGDISVDRICEYLSVSFLRWYKVWEDEGLQPTIREFYLAQMWQLGQNMRVNLNAEQSSFAEGVNLGIDSNGSLLLDSGNSSPAVITTGDVLFQR